MPLTAIVVLVIVAALGIAAFSLPQAVLQERTSILRDAVANGLAALRGGEGTMPKATAPELEEAVHRLVNERRAEQGLPALAPDDALSAVARAHSADMAARAFFDHVNPDGKTPSDRAAVAGYRCVKLHGVVETEGVAENIAQDRLYASISGIGPVSWKDYAPAEAIAAGVVQGWMESPGHRENILGKAYDRVGTGVAVAADEQVFLTQNFC